MKHQSVLFTILLAGIIGNSSALLAQTPMFKTQTGTSSSNSPFNSTDRKTQIWYNPADLQPTPLSGTISKIWFRNSMAGAVITYNSIIIRLKQPASGTGFTGTSFQTGLNTVLNRTNYTISGNAIADGWFSVTLDSAFNYNPALPLVCEVITSGYYGGIVTRVTNIGAGTAKKLISSTSTSSTGSNANGAWNDFGIDVLPACTAPPSAGQAVLNNTSYTCADSVFNISLQGYTPSTGQTYQWQYAASATGPWADTGNVLLTPAKRVVALQDTWFRCKVSCSGQDAFSAPVHLNIAAKLPGGNYTIDNTQPTGANNFHSFTEAVNAMYCGVSGPVTFTVSAGQVFNEAVPPINGIGSAATPIVFQKAPGANTVIARTDTGSYYTPYLISNGDAVITLDGTDYITFDGISVSASSSSIENGYLIRRASSDNGAKHVTIKNATITMNRGTKNTVSGIFCSNFGFRDPPGNSGFVVTSTEGRHEYITITGNTISNVNCGIITRGSNYFTNVRYWDTVFVIGTLQNGNTITDYITSVSTVPADGIQARSLLNVSVVNNTINNSTVPVNQQGQLSGIFIADYNDSSRISNNNIQLKTSYNSGRVHGIINESPGKTSADSNTIAITTNYCYSTKFISIAGPASSISYNRFGNSTFSSAQEDGYLIHNKGAGTTVIQHNFTDTIIQTSNSGVYFYGYMSEAAGGADYFLNNRFTNIKTSGRFAGYYSAYNPKDKYVSYNTIANIEAGNEFAGIDLGGSYSHRVVSYNKVYNLKLVNASSAPFQIYGIRSLISGYPQRDSIYNNVIGSIDVSTGSGASTIVTGLKLNASSVTSTGSVAAFYNTIYLNTQSAGTVAGIEISSYVAQHASEIKNNIIVNNSATTGTGNQYITAFRRSGSSIKSDNNILHVGQLSSKHGIYVYDFFVLDSTMSDVRNRTGNELASVYEMPHFISTNPADPNYLHLDPTIPSAAEGSAIPVVGITEDVNGTSRNAQTPDIGAIEFNGVAGDTTGPGVYILPSASVCTNGDTLLVYISDARGVDNTAGSKPRLYYKKTTEVNQLAANNTSASVGWKWVTAINNTSPFKFFVDPSLLSTAVVAGDTLEYFVVAKDNFTPPNFSASDVNLAIPPTSTALNASHFPVANVVYRYAIKSQLAYSIAADKLGVCASAASVRLFKNTSDLPGTSLQWQHSAINTTNWTDIAGGNADTINISSLSASMQYRLIAACNAVPISTSPSNVVSVTLYNASLVSTTPATKCGEGASSVTLTAAAPTGSHVNWYSSLTATTPVDTGNVFNTPVLNTPVTYYAAVAEKIATAHGGILSTTSSSTVNNVNYGMSFTITRPVVLDAVDVYSAGGTQMSVQLYNADGTVLLKTTILQNLALNAKSTINLGWHLYPGTYRIKTGTVNGNFKRESTGGFPVQLNDFGTINGSFFTTTGSVSSGSYYWFYNWSLTGLCISDRVGVSADVEPSSLWVGSINNAWEEPGNWSCGVVPGAATRVIIPANATLNIASNNTVYSITVNTGATVTILPGYTLTVLH